MSEFTPNPSEVDLLRFENELFRRGLRSDDVEEVYNALKYAGLVLAKRVKK